MVECEFDGVRQMQNECYLSNVKVIKVFKGNSTLTGNTIGVYEPVYTRYQTLDGLRMCDNYNEVVQKFDLEGQNKYLVSSCFNVGDELADYSMLNKGEKYLLFLNKKKYPSQKNMAGVTPAYVLIDSGYAKLALNTGTTAVSYKPPKGVISLRESLDYEVLITDHSSVETFFTGKKLILTKLGLQ